MTQTTKELIALSQAAREKVSGRDAPGRKPKAAERKSAKKAKR